MTTKYLSAEAETWIRNAVPHDADGYPEGTREMLRDAMRWAYQDAARGNAEPPVMEGAQCPGYRDLCQNPALCAERGCVRQR